MNKRYDASLTPKGSLTEIVRRIFQGKGEETEINGEKYVLRERGETPEEMRFAIRSDLEKRVRLNPGSIQSTTYIPQKNEPEEYACRGIFSLAEEIPSIEEDGDYEYTIIEGVRYRVDWEGDKEKVFAYKSKMIRLGRDRILNCWKGQGKMPKKMVLGYNIEKTKVRESFKFE